MSGNRGEELTALPFLSVGWLGVEGVCGMTAFDSKQTPKSLTLERSSVGLNEWLGLINDDSVLFNCIMPLQKISPSIPSVTRISRQFKLRLTFSECFSYKIR